MVSHILPSPADLVSCDLTETRGLEAPSVGTGLHLPGLAQCEPTAGDGDQLSHV